MKDIPEQIALENSVVIPICIHVETEAAAFVLPGTREQPMSCVAEQCHTGGRRRATQHTRERVPGRYTYEGKLV